MKYAEMKKSLTANYGVDKITGISYDIHIRNIGGVGAGVMTKELSTLTALTEA